MQSVEDAAICDRHTDQTQNVVCRRYCAICGACELVDLVSKEKKDSERQLRDESDLYHTLKHRQKICPMYGPCPAGQEMSIDDTCVPTLSEDQQDATDQKTGRLYTRKTNRASSSVRKQSKFGGSVKKGSVKKGSVKKGSVKKGSVKKGSVKKSFVKKGFVKKSSVKERSVKKRPVKKGVF